MSGMHGRVKESVNEEVSEAEKKRKDEKLKKYLQARNALFAKIKDSVFDEDGLKLSSEILSHNPDFYTLWNYRRRAILARDVPEFSNEKPRTWLDSELALTEVALRKNPKSYSAWHHRAWSISRAGTDDHLQAELRYCEQALQLDDRNFHCWDYRRFICRLCHRSAAEELAFIEKKVCDNFSNYSAWHGRSALLPVVHPAPPLSEVDRDDQVSRRLPVDVATFERELNFVQNAFFTDPEDQSSWFYHNWLFEASEARSPHLLQAVLDATSSVLYLVFDQAVFPSQCSPVVSVQSTRAGAAERRFGDLPWHTADAARSCRLIGAPLPGVSLTDLLSMEVKYRRIGGSVIGRKLEDWRTPENHVSVWTDLAAFRSHVFTGLFTSDLKRALEEDLDGCKKLVALEPDNHWACLTAANAMIALDPVKFTDEIVANLKKLLTLDPARKNMYNYMLSKYVLKLQLLNSVASGPPDRRLNLSGLDLRFLGDGVWFVHLRVLVINGNKLSSLHPLKYALTLEELYANDNRLASVAGLEGLPKLRNVSVANNQLRALDDLKPLATVRHLRVLILTGNSISSRVTCGEVVKALASNDSLIVEL